MQTTFSTGLGLSEKNNDVAGIGLSWGNRRTAHCEINSRARSSIVSN